MSLSWQTTATSLVQVGFSVGDIATLAGAGRAIVTWMTSKSKDAALLEFLDVDSDTLIERKGIVDVIGLKNRWGKDLKLFLDGKCHRTLTLVSAALYASLQEDDFNDLLTKFVLDLFDDHPSQEYLRHELGTHIGGWKSFATVHRLLDAARREWTQLARSGVHPLGCIPRSDGDEILRFLKWLTKDNQSKRLATASSDVFSLALVLQHIGIDDLRTHNKDDGEEPMFEDKHFVVILSCDATESGSRTTQAVRKGMPIPLNRPENIMHFWPDQRHKNSNPLQDLFIRGMHEGKGIKFELNGQANDSWANDPEGSRDFMYKAEEPRTSDFQLTGMLGTVADNFFPYLTDGSRKVLLEIAHEAKWNPVDCEDGTVARHCKKAICDNKIFHGMFQSFLLGFWYAALASLVDTSRMESTEAFGSWGWWDYDPVDLIRTILEHAELSTIQDFGGGFQLWRHDVLKISAYLFAGASMDLIRRVDNRTTGVMAKLCILSASMLGLSTSREQAGKLYLLDIDPSCIPHRQGIVLAGRAPISHEGLASSDLIQIVDGKTQLQGCTEDFTAHIEPDWSNDRQTSLICFRSKGRIVQRLSPLDCDIQAVLRDTVLHSMAIRTDDSHIIQIDEPEPPKAYVVPIAAFHGAEILTHPAGERNNIPLLIPTKNLPRARTCILAMYATVLGERGMSPRHPYKSPEALKDCFVLYDADARPILLA